MSNTNNREIERKFLVANDAYKSLATSHERITQGYLAVTDKATVRVRRYGEHAYITVKGRPEPGHIGRFEWEKPITPAEAEALFPLCRAGLVDKTRWLVPLPDGLVCEVDEFHGENRGLILAEIELPEENYAFAIPPFLSDEVTDDHRYYNSYLSACPFTTW